MNNFQKNESIGRAKFEALLIQQSITKYHFTEDEYNPVDCYFNQNHQCNIAEIKVRKQLYSTLFMEQNKFISMCKLIKSGAASKGYYVNFIGNVAYIFDLHDIYNYLKNQKSKGKRVFVKRQLPKTTSGDTKRVWKLVTELPLNLANRITLK